jgi:YfiH family protein
VDVIRPDWPAHPRVKACMTLRSGGVSRAPFETLNLGDHVGDAAALVGENRSRLRKILPGEPCWLRQVHGCVVACADEGAVLPQADAAFSRRAGTVCAVMTADCLPVLFCDGSANVVAAAHAGWRGLAAGVLEATVAAMQTPANGILAWMGAAIGPQAFEVGGEVRQTFVDDLATTADAFTPGNEVGKWWMDIYRLARLRLARIGVTEVYGGGLCTYTDGLRFFSFRRDGTTGRMASLIWLQD